MITGSSPPCTTPYHAAHLIQRSLDAPRGNMSIPTTWLPYLTTLAVVAYGTRIRVDVGSNGAPALVYTPRTVTARVGDIVDFHFIDENAASSVVRGLAGAPCTPYPVKKKGFFNSGFILGDPTGVNETTPIPIYCSVGGHCRAGMVGYINPGQGDIEAYASGAAALSKNEPPPMVAQTGGGVPTGCGKWPDNDHFYQRHQDFISLWNKVSSGVHSDFVLVDNNDIGDAPD
ncbi:hypothetical protein PG989_005444 [Apiospora arundinis]